jgi:hypothetical protein
VNALVLSIDKLSGEDAQELKTWLEPILDAVDADVLVADGTDGFKKVSDETGPSQQVCKSPVGRNTDTLVNELSALIMSNQNHSLQAIGVSPEQALLDLNKLKEMTHTRSPEEQPLPEASYFRYANARKPAKGKKHDSAYRIQND